MKKVYNLILKRILFVLAGCLLAVHTANAQLVKITPGATSRIAKRWATPVTEEMSEKMYETLYNRVMVSNQNVIKSIQKYPVDLNALSEINFMPGKGVTSLLKADPKALYPDAPFLQNDEEMLTAYALARFNREQISRAAKVQAHYQAVLAHMQDFAQAKTRITHAPDEDVSWLVSQIPQNTSYLLVGEYHLDEGVMGEITSLVYQLRLRQPKRQIIVLSEYLQQGTLWDSSIPIPKPAQWMFGKFNELGIPVIGLEPAFVKSNRDFNIVGPSFIDSNGQKHIYQNRFWATGEGVRLRNERYLKTIRQIHQKFPDALLVLHAGAGHVEYSQPYSLGDALAGPNTQVISFRPEKIQNTEKPGAFIPYISPFDNMTNHQFVKDRILQFNDPTLTKLSGANILVRSPF